jgi:hypothetical protein
MLKYARICSNICLSDVTDGRTDNPGGDFSIKDPVAEEVVVCAHTEDLFGGRNSYQGAAVFTETLVDNATEGKINKGDRCGEVQWLESGGSKKSHDVTFGTQCLRRPREQGCHYVRGTMTLRVGGDRPDL